MNRFAVTLVAGSLATAITSARAEGLAIPMGYVGANARVGLSVDLDGKLQGEALGVLGDDDRRAFLLEGWLGTGSSAGLKGGYHWLWGGGTISQFGGDSAAEAIVAKVFAAADQNRFGDRKASLGVGFEHQNYALDLYLSQALSHERLITSSATTTAEVLTGIDGGRPFRQTITTRLLAEQFEHPYEHGIGLRVARFFEAPLLSVRAGLDYETGRALLDGRQATQWAFSLGLDKHFQRSAHSIGAGLEKLRKSGPFDTPAFGGERDETRAFLRWRYEFGPTFQPTQAYRERQIVKTLPAAPPPPPELRRTELQLSAAALFEFDRAELTERAKLDLRAISARLKDQRVGQIDIVGHTCDIGTDAYNQALSERRAAAVGAWLIAEGIPADAVRTSGLGEKSPLAPNDSDEARARNRRVVLSFSSFDEQAIQRPAEAPRTVTETLREPVPLPPTWIARALRTPAEHKRAVDTYRIERVTETRTVGAREFINRAPVAVNDQALVTDGRPVVITVLQNDSDPDGDALTVAITTPPARGTVAVDARGVVTYTPGPGFTDSDTFRYSVTDPRGLTATAGVTIGVTNRAPVAVNDSASWSDSDPVTINVLANDSDPDGDALLVAITRAPAFGTAVLNADRSITYRPDPSGIVSSVTFEYRVTDSGGRSSTATVTVSEVAG